MSLAWVSPDVGPLAVRFFAALMLSAALVPLCRAVAHRTGHVAWPRGDRWHTRPTALFGGVAIAVTTLALGGLSNDPRLVALPLVGGALIFLVGLTDDVLSLKPATKLIAQIVLASMAIFFGERLQWSSLPALDMLLTLVWIVGVTNAFNLLDNMDGLCAGVALIAGLALMVALAGRPDAAVELRYLAIVLGATAGFLFYNHHPASVFMGDAGSLFLGFTLATLTLTPSVADHERASVLSTIAVPVLVLLIPIFDTTLVTISRLLSGRPVSQGGRDHASHRLVAIGLPEPSAVRVLWGLAAAAGALGFAVRTFADDRAWLLGAVFLLAMVVFAVYLAQVRVYENASAVAPAGVTPVLTELMYKSRVAEVLLDFCLVTIAYYGAWRLRFEGADWEAYFPRFLESLPIALAVQLVVFFIVGVYRGAWRHFGLMDAVTFGKGVTAGTLAIIAAIVYLYRFENYSRGVFVIYAALLMILVSGSRASFRLIGEYARRRRSGSRVVIYGAAGPGTVLLRGLLQDDARAYRMCGFIDDDRGTHGFRVQGYPVLGGEGRLLQLIAAGQVDVVAVGARTLAPERLARLEEACRRHGVVLLRLTYWLETLVPSA
jgi:UDP-GlcNAc:undecaprenyl-phosphate/decaprenyl-phosphate GlcNAc-1-phosphate transferase